LCLPTKLQVLANFLPKKVLQPFIYHHPYSPNLSPPDYFLFQKLKMKLKGLHFVDVAEIQEAVTDELKKVQKSNFQQLFRNCMTTQKPVYMQMELIFNKKKLCDHIMCLKLKKKISRKTFGPHCVFCYCLFKLTVSVA
jgi:hypothetical protein